MSVASFGCVPLQYINFCRLDLSKSLYGAHKADDTDPDYHRVLLTEKQDGVSAEPFSYISTLDGNGTAPTDGAPFRMSAPSPYVGT